MDEKPLGSFTEGRLEVAMLRWRRPGPYALVAGPAGGLLYVQAGSLDSKAGRLGAHAALHLPAHHTAEFAAAPGAEVLLVRFPSLAPAVPRRRFVR